MQVLIDQSRLAKALQVIGRIVPKRPVSPVLSSVLLSASDGRVHLRATDLQSFADIDLPAQVHLAGEAAVFAKVFCDVVATLPPGDVAVSRSGSGESLRITLGPAAFRLRTLDPADFPSGPEATGWDAELKTDDLIDLIARTTFSATDSDDVSPFAGVLVQGGDGDLTMAATDSYQLAYYRLPADVSARGTTGPGGDLKAVLPTGGLNAFARALPTFGGDQVQITWQSRAVVFRSDGVGWSIRRLDVEYPDVSRFVGPLAGVQVKVERERLLAAVRQVSSVAEDGYRTLGIELKGDRLLLFASQQELGEAQTAISLEEHYPPRQVWLDARRLTNALKAQPSQDVLLCLSEPLAPVVLVPASEGIRFRTILMPLRHYLPESEAM